MLNTRALLYAEFFLCFLLCCIGGPYTEVLRLVSTPKRSYFPAETRPDHDIGAIPSNSSRIVCDNSKVQQYQG